MSSLKVVFLGTPELAKVALARIIEAGYEVPLVITQPDRPRGRGQRVTYSPVKELALAKGLAVSQPTSLKDSSIYEEVASLKPDVLVVAAYGRILPPTWLDLAPLGAINIHASLLPDYRGAAPIQWALLDGKEETGVSIMKMDEGLDTGPVLLMRRLKITPTMDHGELYSALAELGGDLLLEALPLWSEGRLAAEPQGDSTNKYARCLDREDEAINWTDFADKISNQVRAFSPLPGAFSRIDGKEIKILAVEKLSLEEETELLQRFKAELNVYNAIIDDTGSGRPKTADVQEMGGKPGMVVGSIRRKGPVVATGKGLLILTKVLPVGKKPMDGWSWLNGSRIEIGATFGGEGG